MREGSGNETWGEACIRLTLLFFLGFAFSLYLFDGIKSAYLAEDAPREANPDLAESGLRSGMKRAVQIAEP